MNLESKLERSLRKMRRNVFSDSTPRAEAASRAISRLKASRTFAAMVQRNENRANQRLNEKLTRQGY